MIVRELPDVFVREHQRTPGGALRGGPVQALANLLRSRGVVVTPSDTCFGLSAIPVERSISQTVNDLLGRAAEPISLAFGRMELIEQWARLTVLESRLLEAFTPGPITVVCEASENVPPVLVRDALAAPNNAIGVRIPDSQIERQLVNAVRYPLTSAAIRDPLTGEAIRDFDTALAVVREGLTRIASTRPILLGAIEYHEPFRHPAHSTVVRIRRDVLSTGTLEIIREGAIPSSAIREAIERISMYEIQDWT